MVAALPALGADEILYFGRQPVRVDLQRTIPVADFEEAWPCRVDTTWDGVAVQVIGCADLIASKLASGRSQDRRDAKALARAQERRDGPGRGRLSPTRRR